MKPFGQSRLALQFRVWLVELQSFTYIVQASTHGTACMRRSVSCELFVSFFILHLDTIF